jgi:hypothetical protein
LRKEWKANEAGYVARHALALLARRGEPAEVVRSLAEFWREDRKDFEKAARKAAAKLRRTVKRYEAALERLRLARGLPDEAALEKIQRYEAHLERGFHKALERLQSLQEARGAVLSSHKPAVALAVFQPAPEPAGMASFGASAIEAVGVANGADAGAAIQP